MNKLLIGAAIVFAVSMAGCAGSQPNPLGTGFRNLMAYNCANGQTILGQVPTGVLTPAQVQMAADAACSSVFGTTAAPASAPGNMPMFPGAPVAPAK